MTGTAEGHRLRRHAHFRVFSSHRDAMRTGAALIVQRGNFVIAGGCGPIHNLIRCGFTNELLAGEPENFTHIGIGFSRSGIVFVETSRISLLFGETMIGFCPARLASSLPVSGRKGPGLCVEFRLARTTRKNRRARIRKLRISAG